MFQKTACEAQMRFSEGKTFYNVILP